LVPIGEFGFGGPGGGGHLLVTMAGGSGGSERVVAELGQDVMGLPEDLAGLGQAVRAAAAGKRRDEVREMLIA